MLYLNVTLKSMEDARKLARELVEKKLAGIVSMAPLASVYPINGKVDERDEALLKITTTDQKMQGDRGPCARTEQRKSTAHHVVLGPSYQSGI